jgi:hypothetical protein
MWQLGIEMRPLFERRTAIGYPIFASISAAFGYYLEGVEDRQNQILADRKASLLTKRARHAECETPEAGEGATAVSW